MAHVAEYKKRIVNELTKLISDYPVVAVVSVENVPAPQLQKVRAQIRDNVVIRTCKRRLIKLAFDKAGETKKGVEKLKEHLKGMPALMFTKENPFRLSAMLIKSKSKAPAKAGQTAPNDIVIEAGPTSFAPGPIIGELGQLGIKTKVEDGKIAIKENVVLVKKGEKVDEKAAAVLTRLGIEPMEIGLMPEAAYEDGLIYTRDVLEVSEEEYINRLCVAYLEAFNLAFEINYPIKEVVEIMIGKAFNEAKAVGVEFKIIDKEIIDSLLGIAESEMTALKEIAKIDVSEKKEGRKEKVEEIKEKKTEVKEEKKEEIKEEKGVKEVSKEEVKEEKKERIKEKPKVEEITKKEEKILEEEKEIIKEEAELEKKEPEGAPVEKEVEEEVKEEEEKLLEKERIEKEKELEKIEEEKEEIEEEKPEEKPVEEAKEEEKDEPKEEVDKKIEEMVKKTKDFVEGKIPTAEKLLDEAEEEIREGKEEEERKEEPKEKKKAKEVKKEKIEEKPKERKKEKKKVMSAEEAKKKEKEEKERKEVEELVKKLQRGEKI